MCVDEITRPIFTQPSLINKNGKGGMKLENHKKPSGLTKKVVSLIRKRIDPTASSRQQKVCSFWAVPWYSF